MLTARKKSFVIISKQGRSDFRLQNQVGRKHLTMPDYKHYEKSVHSTTNGRKD